MKGRGWNLRTGQPDGDRGRRMGAPLGWQALVESKGLEKAHAKLQEWRLANPTELEQVVMDALDGMGKGYEREHLLTDGRVHCFVDFLVGGVALEVDGHAFHGGDLTPLKDYDEVKARLCEIAGLRLVRLPEELVTGGGLAAALEKEMEG